MGLDEYPRLGDDFRTAGDIKPGDLVYWDRGADGILTLRRLEQWQVASCPRTVFRVDRVRGPRDFDLTPIKWADSWCAP
jgi:hypothetical protein